MQKGHDKYLFLKNLGYIEDEDLRGESGRGA